MRSPWDWYVSLRVYGAEGKSAIMRHPSAHLVVSRDGFFTEVFGYRF